MNTLKSKAFFDELASRLGLKPGTCRAYLRLAGYKPAEKRQANKFVECLWLQDQLTPAETAIRSFMAKFQEGK